MITQYQISRFLNQELRVREIPDASRNGLQANNRKYVRRVGVAVDASLETFRKAKKRNCDLLIVHHGLFWKGKRDETGLRQKRADLLKRSKMNLYTVHLPLDMHEEYGNNIQLARLLELEKIEEFGKYHGMNIGYKGKLKEKLSMGQLKNRLDRALKTRSQVLEYGRSDVRSIGIISGGPVSIADAMEVDCFISGEGIHSRFVDAKDLKLNIIYAGHYETETLGVDRIGKLLKERFDLEYEFI